MNPQKAENDDKDSILDNLWSQFVGDENTSKTNAKYIWIFLAVLMVGFLFYAFPDSSHTSTNQTAKSLANNSHGQNFQKDKYLSVKTDKGNIVYLPYLNSKLYRAKPIPEPPLTKITITNITKIQQYLSQTPKMKKVTDLFENWQKANKTIDQIQYYRLNQHYNLDRKLTEKGICIVSPYRNLLNHGIENGTFNLFLKSVDGQNYSNYHVFMIDDVSTDGTSDVVFDLVAKFYPRLNNRLTIIKNKEQLRALGNRDSTIRNHCPPGHIVIDVDADDNLIGKQVFNLFNRLYQNNPDAWFIYTNYLRVRGSETGDGRDIVVDLEKSILGYSKEMKPAEHDYGTYRTDIYEWATSHTRTYLRDLFVKIPLSYVLERGTGKYYLESSDRFAMYALAELAGPKHTRYFEQYTYFYYAPNYKALASYGCFLSLQYYCEAQSRVLVPLMPLPSLKHFAEQTPFYDIPVNILQYYIDKEREFSECKEDLFGLADIFRPVDDRVI